MGDIMLLSLSINNLAVFETGNINFHKGLNIITGETGSGKSIIIESVLLLLGMRANRNLIRKGQTKAIVEAVFDITKNDRLIELLIKNGFEIDEDNLLIISRELLSTGKSISRINNRMITLNNLKIVSSYLINIHGQFGHQSLLKKENHIKILDNLMFEEVLEIKKKYKDTYKYYKKLIKEIDELHNSFENKESRIEQLKYELDEINSANIKNGEEDSLLKQIKKLSNIKEIKNSLEKVVVFINDSDTSAINNIIASSKILTKIKDYDEELSINNSKLDIIIDNIQELLFNILNYTESLQVDKESINLIEERISLINRMKRKYGYTFEKIEEYKENCANELKFLLDIDLNIAKLNKEIDAVYKKLKLSSNKLTDIRKKSAHLLEKNIIQELNDLNMKNVNFKVSIDSTEDFTEEGKDDIEFLISTNVGSDLDSVQKIVSGGEASRLMLAFKKIMSDIDLIPTIVFDEIDTGISGKTSQMAGIKMKYISDNHQVICVTHSPQVASFADKHLLIEKNISKNSTYSIIKKLEDDERTQEIARLLSGMNITEKSINNAKELIDFSNKI